MLFYTSWFTGHGCHDVNSAKNYRTTTQFWFARSSMASHVSWLDSVFKILRCWWWLAALTTRILGKRRTARDGQHTLRRKAMRCDKEWLCVGVGEKAATTKPSWSHRKWRLLREEACAVGRPFWISWRPEGIQTSRNRGQGKAGRTLSLWNWMLRIDEKTKTMTKCSKKTRREGTSWSRFPWGGACCWGGKQVLSRENFTISVTTNQFYGQLKRE